jgi:hypothetical protein
VCRNHGSKTLRGLELQDFDKAHVFLALVIGENFEHNLSRS